VGRLRVTTHYQWPLPVTWTTQGFPSWSTFARWDLPLPGGHLLAHGGYVWNGRDGLGADLEDEIYWGLGFRFPETGQFAGLLAVGGFVTPSFNRAYVAPNLLFRIWGLNLMGGIAWDLSPTPVHVIHLGLHAFGEPK